MKHWKSKPLGEVCQFSNGLWKGVKPPFVKVGVIRNTNFTKEGTLDESNIAYLEVEERQLEKRRLKFGDIILEKSGGGPKQPVGRVALFNKKEGEFSFSNFTAALRILNPQELDFQFTHRFLHWAYLSGVTERMQSNSTGIRNLDASAYKAIEIPVPPLIEQHRIVQLLDEADELRRLRAQANRHANTLISALFHEMFGKLIAVPPVVTSTVGVEAPPKWRWAQLTDVARLATGHTPSRRHPEWWGGKIPWISLTDIRDLDGTIATNTSECVNEEGIANSSSVKLPEGTVCFSRTASVGFVTVMGQEMATSQDFVNWVCGPQLVPLFLMGALMQARDHLRSLASGSTHKTIYFPTVKQFAVIVPPLELQREFAARMTAIRNLQTVQATSRDRSTETQDILALKAACYLDYYKSGGLAVRNGQPRSAYKEFPFRVLFVFKSTERRNNAAERLLQNQPPIFTQVWLTTMAEVLADPFGAIWIRPVDYRDATEGTAYAPGATRGFRYTLSLGQVRNEDAPCVHHEAGVNFAPHLRAGADGYITKPCDRHVQARVIEETMAGGHPIASDMTMHLVQAVVNPPKRRMQPHPRLSTRENEVMALVAQGMENKDIAGRLGLSIFTVNAHLQSIYGKLNVGIEAIERDARNIQDLRTGGSLAGYWRQGNNLGQTGSLTINPREIRAIALVEAIPETEQSLLRNPQFRNALQRIQETTRVIIRIVPTRGFRR